jgi:hypothetical protein
VKHFDVLQGSREWFSLRKGIPTASEMDKLLTPKGFKPSAQADKYLCKLLAEWFLDTPFEVETRVWAMDVGIEREQQSIEYYEFFTGRATTPAGFCLHDSGLVGASPDRFVGEEGLLEAKNPLPHTQVSYLLAGDLPAEYLLQTQTQLYVTGRAWLDFLSFFPGLPALLVRVLPLPEVQGAIHQAVASATQFLAVGKRTLTALQGGPPA